MESACIRIQVVMQKKCVCVWGGELSLFLLNIVAITGTKTQGRKWSVTFLDCQKICSVNKIYFTLFLQQTKMIPMCTFFRLLDRVQPEQTEFHI